MDVLLINIENQLNEYFETMHGEEAVAFKVDTYIEIQYQDVERIKHSEIYTYKENDDFTHSFIKSNDLNLNYQLDDFYSEEFIFSVEKERTYPVFKYYFDYRDYYKEKFSCDYIFLYKTNMSEDSRASYETFSQTIIEAYNSYLSDSQERINQS